MTLSFPSSFSPASSIPAFSRGKKPGTNREFITHILLCCLVTALPSKVTAEAANELAEAETEGRRLAQEILELRPAENFTHDGVLKIFKGRGKPLEIPVRCETVVTETNWAATYSTQGTNAGNTASFTVIHAPGQANHYLLRPSAESCDQTHEGNLLTGDNAMIPFAGSDFWLADLGLEFLHWSQQKLLRKEMRKGQFCNVLESVDAHPSAGAYARVVSWLDIDTGGIVQARAYDVRDKRLKEFDVKGMTKVNGRWQVDEFLIRNEQTGSRTKLEFDFDKKPSRSAHP